MPLGIKNGYAFWPPMPTDEELSIAGLSADGKHVKGWVKTPSDHVWKPHDLLWTPPGAKSGDFDRAGEVVDVVDLDTRAFVTAALAKRAAYMDRIRQLVRAGRYKLTAQLAEWLGMDYDDGAELTPASGTVAYGKSLPATKAMIEEGRRMAGALTKHKSWCRTGHPADWPCDY